ncbi:MAG: phenylacetate--CoA ligase family protein [Thermodesulfobacteriota bacterium]
MNLPLNFERFHTLYRLWRHPLASRDDLILFQNRKLRHLVANAYANVTHYREIFDGAGLKPEDIQTVEDLHLIPLTSKDDLRMRPVEETLTKGVDPRKLVSLKTSGSSGKPFTILLSTLEEHLINMFRIRARGQIGVRISDRIACVHEEPLGGRKRGLPGHLRQAFGIYRDYFVNGLKPAEDIIRELERLKPDVLAGYPSSLGHAAVFLTGTSISGIRPRLVITGGEVLSSSVRDCIEKCFCAPVFDMYGAHEFNLLAWECPQGGAYHVCDDNVILEILSNGRPGAAGETGEVVATALHSYTMPFIRYRTGDIGTRGTECCQCGQPFSTLLHIKGRCVDYFRLPGNRYVHPYEITGPLIDHESSWIFQHQMVQESVDNVILKIATLREPKREELERLKNLGEQKLGPEVEFTIELVENFPMESGKKFNPYICLVSRESEQFDQMFGANVTRGKGVTG